jgi:hypothetical protein
LLIKHDSPLLMSLSFFPAFPKQHLWSLPQVFVYLNQSKQMAEDELSATLSLPKVFS